MPEMRDLDLLDPLLRTGDAVVSASAGSGKTFTLTVLVTAELGLGSVRPFDILATTFSEAAASDLRERLLRPLDLLGGLGAAEWNALLVPLRDGDGADFAHALGQLALPERLGKSVEEVRQAARLWASPPEWTASAEAARAFWRRTRREAEGLRVSTLHALALSLLRQGESPDEILDAEHPALLRLLREAFRDTLALPEGHPDSDPARRLLRWAESHWDTLSKGHDAHRDALGHLAQGDASALRGELERALDAAEGAFAPFLWDFSTAYKPKRDGSRPAYAKPTKLKAIPRSGSSLGARLAWAEAQSSSLWEPDGKMPGYWSEGLAVANATLACVTDALEEVMRNLLSEALLVFESHKRCLGYATFGDLVRRATEELQAGSLTPPRPALLLVDEYQDTSRVQDAFLAELGAARILRVGDAKQSIYGFRGGDPELLRERLEAAGARAFRLPKNHRSAEPIVALANTYVDSLWPRLDPSASGLDGAQAAVRPAGAPVGFLRTEARGRGKDLPALEPWIAALAQEAGWAQSLGESGQEGARTRALVLQQRTGLPALLRRLKARGIRPYVLARNGFWESPGVRLLLAALEAAVRPERPAPAAALLRRIGRLTDRELCELARAGGGRLPGLGALDPEALPEAKRERGRWLKALLGATTQEIAGRCLAEGSLLAGLAALEAHGPMEPIRARRNLAAFMAMVEELPAGPATAWIHLQQMRDGIEKGDVPAGASGADLLVTTAHGSKGLEYDDVILPLLHGQTRAIPHGQLLTEPSNRELLFGWKLGKCKGAGLARIQGILAARSRRDSLNLLYVALTRAKHRLVLLEQGPAAPTPEESAGTWAEWGLHLRAAHAAMRDLEEAPAYDPPQREAPPRLVLERERPPLPPPAVASGQALHGSLRARRDGEAMHAFVRDLLLRWDDPAAFARCLEQAPDVPRAREMAQDFLAQMERRGLRHGQRRRTEFPLEGAAASGALGRADLVVWREDRICLIDLKHSEGFQAEELERYRAQLQRYARALRQRNPGLPVEAWLVALRSGQWLLVETG